MRQPARLFRNRIFLTLLAVNSVTLAADPFSYQTPMKQVASGSYYVQGGFGSGIKAEFLVDTGSGYVALTPATFKQLKRETDVDFDRSISGRMANGKLITVPVYRVAQLWLGDGCVLRDVEVTVLSGSDRNILGLSALRKVEPFALQLDPPTLYMSECVTPPERIVSR